MSTIELPEGAPEEVVTKALVRDVDLTPFGFSGKLALITLDNGHDHNRPNTFGPTSLRELDAAITTAIATKPAAIGVTGKPFIFAAGADLSGLAFINQREQSLAIGKLGHDVFRRLGDMWHSHLCLCEWFSTWWWPRSRTSLQLSHAGFHRPHGATRGFPWLDSWLGWRDSPSSTDWS
jgi:hypothetical protein